MKSTKFPCNTCPANKTCFAWCNTIINYYGRFIRGYANAGCNSYVYNAMRTEFRLESRRTITKAIDRFFNIRMTHPNNSEDCVCFNRSGRVIDRGPRDLKKEVVI